MQNLWTQNTECRIMVCKLLNDPPAPSGDSCVGQITQSPPHGTSSILTMSMEFDKNFSN